MVTLRRLVFAAALVVLILLTGMFAYSNPTPIDIDIGIARFESVSMAVAFAVTIGVGWLFGVLSAAVALWRSAGEKRRLRQDLEYAEAERQMRETPP